MNVSISPILEQVQRQTRVLEPSSPGTGPRMRLRGSTPGQEGSEGDSPRANVIATFRSGMEPLAKMVSETNRMVGSHYRAMALSFRDMGKSLDRIRRNTAPLRNLGTGSRALEDGMTEKAGSEKTETGPKESSTKDNPQDNIQKQLKEQLSQRSDPKLKLSTSFFGLNTNLLALIQYMKIVENDRWEQTQHILLSITGISKSVNKIAEKLEVTGLGMKEKEKESDGWMSSMFIGAMGWLGSKVGGIISLLGDAGKAVSGFMETVGGLSGMFTSLVRYGTVLARGGAVPVAIAAGLAYITWGAIEAKSIIDDIAKLRSDTAKIDSDMQSKRNTQASVVVARKMDAENSGNVEKARLESDNLIQLSVMDDDKKIRDLEEELSNTPAFFQSSKTDALVDNPKYDKLIEEIQNLKKAREEKATQSANYRSKRGSSKGDAAQIFMDRAFNRSSLSQMPTKSPSDLSVSQRKRSLAPSGGKNSPMHSEKGDGTSSSSTATTINAPVVTSSNVTNNSTQTIAPTMYRRVDPLILGSIIG